jgi:hypothetical protein
MMRNNMKSFTVRASVLAVQGALLTLAALPAAYAQESVAELTKPTNTVEMGVGYTDRNSYKFGEYNGLEKKGGHLLGGFDVSGGGGDDSALRYRITGSDLGLDTRNLGAEFGEQGKFRVTFGYDEIVKNRSDSFMTPYNGAGSNNLTLPTNWATNARNCTVAGSAATVGQVVGTAGCGNYLVVQSSTAKASTATPTGNMLALTAAEIADFHNFNLSTQRKKADLGINLALNNQWQISATASHEKKEGALAIGQPFGTTNAQVTVPNPIDYTTNQFELKVNYKGEKSFAQASYYASIFQNGIQSVTYQNPYFSSAVPVISATGVVTYPWNDTGRFASAPANQFHQLNFTGGYNFSKTTKLVANLAYGRNTQDQAFQPLGTGAWETAPAGVLPTSSLHGLVVTKSVDLKLTAKPIKDLQLAAAYKYDEKDNQTPAGRWSWRDTDQQNPYVTGAAAGSTVLSSGSAGPTTLGGMNTTVSGGRNNILTAPYSKKVNQLNLDADWSFMKGQAVKGGLEYQTLKRSCDDSLWTAACENTVDQHESTARIEYRNNMLETVNGRIGYVRSDRRVGTYGQPELVSLVAPNISTRFAYTDRTRDKLRASINWQPVDALDLTAGYDYNKDDYQLGKNPTISGTYTAGGMPVGLDSAKSDVLNLDANYKISDKLSVNAFYSREDTKSLLVGNVNPAANPVATSPAWSANMKEKTDTYGIGFRALQLASKWDLAGDYIKSKATLPYELAGGGASVASTATAYAGLAGTWTDFPNTYSESDQLKFNVKYTVDKHSAWRFTYIYEKLSSANPLTNNGLQIGTANTASAGSATAVVNGVAVPATQVVPLSELMPTNEQAPNYSVQAFGITYIYSFK